MCNALERAADVIATKAIFALGQALDVWGNETLPEALVTYWEIQRDEAKSRAESAERARLRALAKMRKL